MATRTQTSPKSAAPMAPQRVMTIIACLARHGEGQTLTQMADALGTPRTSLFAILRALTESEHVVFQDKRYWLGPKTFEILGHVQHGRHFPANVRHLLQRLQSSTGETALLAQPETQWQAMVYVDVIEANSFLRFTAHIGARRPLMHMAAGGKVLLAFAEASQRAAYLNHAEITDDTPLGQALSAELQEVRDTGVCRSSVSLEDITALSAPVFDHNGHIRAAVVISGPTVRMDRAGATLPQEVHACGLAMSSAMGFALAYPGQA